MCVDRIKITSFAGYLTAFHQFNYPKRLTRTLLDIFDKFVHPLVPDFLDITLLHSVKAGTWREYSQPGDASLLHIVTWHPCAYKANAMCLYKTSFIETAPDFVFCLMRGYCSGRYQCALWGFSQYKMAKGSHILILTSVLSRSKAILR